jgi:propionaldehyde dehydrogenase
LTISNEEIAYIVEEVFKRVSSTGSAGGGGSRGVFPTVDAAVRAAGEAQRALVELGVEARKGLIAAMRAAVLAKADELGAMAVEETGLGRVPDKGLKIRLAATGTPGVEDLETAAYSGDSGLTLIEQAPFGVIGAITPSTNPVETVVSNSIGMVAGGNGVVFSVHPQAKRVSRAAIELLDEAIASAGGPPGLLATVAEPSKEASEELMKHPAVKLLVVTGGPEIVRLAMLSGKKVIGAGPGNPPVVVDETADIAKAARAIVDGASFDNDVLCIAEKEVFVVDSVCDALLAAMEKAGGYRISTSQADALLPHIVIKAPNGSYAVNKKYVGKDASLILSAIGLSIPSDARLAFFEADRDCPLVALEQLMPVMPVVRVRDVAEAIELAVKAEGGCHHTAIMHSRNVENLTAMGRAVDTTIFVKNGPSYAGLGFQGEGFTSYTIATPTGEGVTSPVSFTRKRRCVLKDALRVI